MTTILNGQTRVLPIVGDPIAQVRSPEGLTSRFTALGCNIVCVPLHVAPADFHAFIAFLKAAQNLEGAIITIPHKLAAYEACDELSERSRFLGSVNTITRFASGRLHGDMFDGLGLVAAARGKGCEFRGRRALVIGAGGAGRAIAHAVAGEEVKTIAVADVDIARRDDLVARLRAAGYPAETADARVAGFDIVINATPLGMRPSDVMPVEIEGLVRETFVAEVVTMPELTPLLQAALSVGCRISTGNDMFNMVADYIVDSFAGEARLR